MESIAVDASKHCSWYSSIKFIVQKINTSLNIHVDNITNKFLVEFFIKEWKQSLDKHSDGRLCTYVSFKTNFGIEKYFSIVKNFNHRSALTRFRISAHRLAIETGRYKGIPRHDRLCTRCSENVEDELHFLFSCEGLKCQRDILISLIKEKCKNFVSLSSEAKLIWLLNNEDRDILNALCTYIKNI